MLRKKRLSSSSRAMTGILGGVLLVVCIMGFGWLLRSHTEDNTNSSAWAVLGLGSAAPADVQVSQLAAMGITFSQAQQQPKLSQQQALFLANQLEADAASKAKKTNAWYVLLNYPNAATPATHTSFSNIPVWMIWYQQVPLASSNVVADGTRSSRLYHDIFVFLDANSGKELLSIWA
jgi:hypothetical protein